MKIVVLDHFNDEVDIIDGVSDELIKEKYNGDIGDFLHEELGCAMDCISWMSSDLLTLKFITHK